MTQVSPDGGVDPIRYQLGDALGRRAFTFATNGFDQAHPPGVPLGVVEVEFCSLASRVGDSARCPGFHSQTVAERAGLVPEPLRDRSARGLRHSPADRPQGATLWLEPSGPSSALRYRGWAGPVRFLHQDSCPTPCHSRNQARGSGGENHLFAGRRPYFSPQELCRLKVHTPRQQYRTLLQAVGKIIPDSLSPSYSSDNLPRRILLHASGVMQGQRKKIDASGGRRRLSARSKERQERGGQRALWRCSA